MKIELKYKIGDTVYFLHENKVNTGILKALQLIINAKGQYFTHTISQRDIPNNISVEGLVFLTKEELLASL